MMRALRAVSSEKGRDPREFALVAYGGSGPVHAAGLAAELGVRDGASCRRSPACSPRPGCCSPAPSSTTCASATSPPTASGLETLAARSSRDARGARAADGRGEGEWLRTADLRYAGQSWDIEVDFPGEAIDRALARGLRGAVRGRARAVYGVRDEEGSPVEVRALRLGRARAAARERRPARRRAPVARARRDAARLRRAHGAIETPVRSRAEIGAEPRPGPLLVDEYDTTVVVPPGWSVRRGRGGVLTLSGEAARAERRDSITPTRSCRRSSATRSRRSPTRWRPRSSARRIRRSCAT